MVKLTTSSKMKLHTCSDSASTHRCQTTTNLLSHNALQRHVITWCFQSMGTHCNLEVQVLDAWTILMFSKWINNRFLWCANGEYSDAPDNRNLNLWQSAMDLEFVPWKEICQTYGLTAKEIAPPWMNEDMKPVQWLDVWLLKGSNKVRYGCLACLLP